ncbi:hypothetical protein FQA39_LY04443 [Lamprigera yunnana]|nr:hypothetical protein FQA39_LY04443 [Lamprigera yunnana]
MAKSSAIADAGNFGMLGNFINLQILMNVSDMTFLHEYSDTDENTTQANSIEDYMSESETIEIQDDISIFSSIDELKLKQFKSSYDTTTSKSNQHIEVPLKNESNLEHDETTTSADYSVGSDTLSENFSDINESNNDENKEQILPLIELEKYYVVYYDSGWYVGQIIICNVETDTYTVKFLEEFLGSFSWPKKDDLQTVEKKFLFFGPINLNHSYPFQIERKIHIKNFVQLSFIDKL